MALGIPGLGWSSAPRRAGIEPMVAGEVAARGFAMIEEAVAGAEIERYLGELEQALSARIPSIRARGDVFGVRNLLEVVPSTRQLLDAPKIRAAVSSILGPDARLVRALFFDKQPRANWSVRWHQDQVVALREKIFAPEFSAWTSKAGVPHARAPARILEKMLAVRIHLDACDIDSAPLKVVADSHLHGLLPPNRLAALARGGEIVTCCVPRGGVVLMRPLLIHASEPAKIASHRRVVHLELAGEALVQPARWFMNVALDPY